MFKITKTNPEVFNQIYNATGLKVYEGFGQTETTLCIATIYPWTEPVPGAKDRVRNVLRIMLTAWLAARLQQAAETMLDQLSNEKENENGTERNLPLVTPQC